MFKKVIFFKLVFVTVLSVFCPAVSAEAFIKLDQHSYGPRESIVVSVSDITAQMINEAAWIAIFRIDATYDEFEYDWANLNEEAKEYVLEAPINTGAYEVRLFKDGSSTDMSFIMSAPFNVEDSADMKNPENNMLKPMIPVTPDTVASSAPDSVTLPSHGGSFTTLAVASGVKLAWGPIADAVGYRIYRSATQGVEGISITDFPIASLSYVDVNVDANTTYCYMLRAVMKEANAITLEHEILSEPFIMGCVKTGDTILGGSISDMYGTTKNVVLMKVNDPFMSVNGVRQEIDPGRGTAPQIIFGRTIVPIRAIIETMLGTINWEDATQKITLNANGHSVIMWLNKKEIIVDGQNQMMDVTPVSINGRTMVPVRFAAENVGCFVDWIASTSEIVVVFFS